MGSICIRVARCNEVTCAQGPKFGNFGLYDMRLGEKPFFRCTRDMMRVRIHAQGIAAIIEEVG
jgi:hypothetical protein